MDQRIQALEREIEALRARLDALTQGLPGRSSLRIHHRCPVCDARSVLRIERIADRGESNIVSPLTAIVEPRGWADSGQALGQFVVYACRQCGLAEWYIADVADISDEHPGVTFEDGPPKPTSNGPFR